MATSTYHCPNCRAPIAFNPDRQLYVCDYCNSSFNQEEMNAFFAKQEAKDNQKAEQEAEKEAERQKSAPEGEIHVNEYHCQNCGASVVTDETTTSTFCYYCHSPVIITTRLQGDFKPNQLLPFRIGEERAKKEFLAYCSKKKFLPSDFTSDAQLEKMTGLYLPYWYIDSDVNVNFVGQSKSVEVWRVGDYEYRETSIFLHQRQGTYNINNVNIPAFEKIDRNLLNGVEPFEPEEFQAFTTPMLQGYFTEQATVDKSEAIPIMYKEIDKIAGNMLDSSLGAADIKTNVKTFEHHDHEWKYSLLPIWILTYNYLGKIYVYAMNGQSGRAFGEMPIDMKKLNRHALLSALIAGFAAAVIVYLVMYFFRMGL